MLAAMTTSSANDRSLISISTITITITITTTVPITIAIAIQPRQQMADLSS